MSRSPRRSFAAPFVISLAAAAAPGCAPAAAPTTDTTHNVMTNPPPPPPPDTPYATWNVEPGAEGTCYAYSTAPMECPPDMGMSCNPPAPMSVACPDPYKSFTLVQEVEGGECHFLESENCDAECAAAPATCPGYR